MTRRLSLSCMALALCTLLACHDNAAVQAAPPPTASPAPTATATPAPTAAPEPTATPEPQYQTATVLADNVGIIGGYLTAREPVVALRRQAGFTYVEAQSGKFWVENQFLRSEGEAAFRPYKAYGRTDAAICKDVYLTQPVFTCGKDQALTVYDQLGQVCLVLASDGVYGYIAQENLYRERSARKSSGRDGGDISLSAGSGFTVMPLLLRQNAEEDFTPGRYILAAGGVEAYAALLHRGDTVQVIEYREDYCLVAFGGSSGIMPRCLLRLMGEPTFPVWQGYTQDKVSLYGTYRLLDESVAINTNTALLVIDQIGENYLVQVDDRLGFLRPEDVGPDPVPKAKKRSSDSPAWTDPVL